MLLEEALNAPLGTAVTIEATVVAKDDALQSYTTKTNSTLQYFDLQIANSTIKTVLRVYQKQRFETLRLAKTYRFVSILLLLIA